MTWPTKTIDDVTALVTKGTTPTTLGKVFTDSGIRFIKAEALNGDTRLDEGGMAFIDAETHQLLRRSILERDDVLVTIAGAQIGRCGLVTDDYLPANTNQAVGIVRVDKTRAVPRFVYYFFKQRSTFDLIQGIGAAQAAQPNLNLANLKRIRLSAPSLDTQQMVADTLAAYDELIENNRRRIELLEEAARQLYKEWFVRLRFPGHEHVKVVDGVPKGWRKEPLSNVAEMNARTLSGNHTGRIDYIDIASVTTGSVNSTTPFEFENAPGRARRIVKHGDIIWSCVRPNRQSHAVIWNPKDNLIASTGFCVISPLTVPTSYLYQVLTTPAFVGYLTNNARGVAYPAVVASDFEKYIVAVPPDALLTHFNDLVEPILQMTWTLQEHNKKLAAARDLLLPRLMNGDITV